MQRTFDVALFGATGFTGELVARALVTLSPPGARLLLVGRNRERLDAVRARLPSGARWETAQADSGDGPSLQRLAESTRVVCTTVGPFAKLGLPLVEACARAGTHYADITGEVQFMRDSIDHAHALAAASGARIVHACGFDSIPSDLGVWLLHRHLLAAGRSGRMGEVEFVLESMSGGISGGTVASAVNVLEEASRSRARRRLLADPYALSPDRASDPSGRDERDVAPLRFDARVGRWTGPFVMSTVNTRVVRRTRALLGPAYGEHFRYREVMAFGRGPKGLVRGAATLAGLGAFVGAMQFGPTRALARRLVPAPGTGPDEATRTRGHFRIRLFARSEEGDRLEAVVAGKSDPGYGETAKMLAQAALCLAFDGEQLPARAGVLTPASALGDALLERLRASGMTFAVERHERATPATSTTPSPMTTSPASDAAHPG